MAVAVALLSSEQRPSWAQLAQRWSPACVARLPRHPPPPPVGRLVGGGTWPGWGRMAESSVKLELEAVALAGPGRPAQLATDEVGEPCPPEVAQVQAISAEQRRVFRRLHGPVDHPHVIVRGHRHVVDDVVDVGTVRLGTSVTVYRIVETAQRSSTISARGRRGTRRDRRRSCCRAVHDGRVEVGRRAERSATQLPKSMKRPISASTSTSQPVGNDRLAELAAVAAGGRRHQGVAEQRSHDCRRPGRGAAAPPAKVCGPASAAKADHARRVAPGAVGHRHHPSRSATVASDASGTVESGGDCAAAVPMATVVHTARHGNGHDGSGGSTHRTSRRLGRDGGTGGHGTVVAATVAEPAAGPAQSAHSRARSSSRISVSSATSVTGE